MESLPQLPMEQILLSLDVSDLLTCASVSVAWRAFVNNDLVWKRACYKHSNNSTIEYLQAVSSKISPAFEEPESMNQRLEPLCFWRIVFMKLQHLERNWKNGWHKTFGVIDFACDHFDLKVYDDTLVTNVNDNQCEVWDVRNEPKKRQTIQCALTDARCKCMIHVVENRLVVVQDTLLQVYHSGADKCFRLCYRRLFNQTEEDSRGIPGSLHVDEWYNSLIKRRPSHLQCYHVGKYFIGLAQNGTFDSSSFHVWDTVTGSKLREIKVKTISPEMKDPIYNVKFCNPRVDIGKILVCVHHLQESAFLTEESYSSILYIYDLSTLTFKKLMVLKPHIPWIYYEDRLVLTIGHIQSKITIYDASTGVKLAAKGYEELINPDSVQVHKNHIGFTTGGDLVILNVEDFDLFFTTAIIKFSSNLFGFDFVFLDWNLVLLAQWDKVNKIQVWDIEKKLLLSTLGTTGLMFPSNNLAKFFVWNEMVTTIYMLQFW